MNSETTTQEFKIQLLHGWLVSCLLHGLLLFSFLPIFRQSLITVPQELFHWDVALVESVQTADSPIHTVETAQPAVSKPQVQAPHVAQTNRTTQHAASHPIRTTSPEPTADTLAASELQPDSPSTIPSQAEPTTTALRSDEPTPNLVQTNDPPLQQTAPPISSTTQEPGVPETVAASTQGNIPTTEAGQLSPPPVANSAPDSASMPRVDYGWLQQAIFRRLEELKRSSPPLFDQSQPLKVLVRAIVSQEGTLLDATVVKSSGLDRIDQEAMALVQRAFPMQLDRTLDRRQIAMRIPITYSRD